ncbi:MAG: NAD(P)/FAD-dependent oxidoreductase [Anaerolineales bacterium]|nr:MAG: NAD(P)/FAD-dependent oxidoreductase [Anaerolineales bacterium]
MNIAIIGAGVAGLTAAYELTKVGHRVVVFEAADKTGGLASGFKDQGWEWSLERFYHHWFASDDEVINLIKEIGQEEKLFFPRPITSIWHKGKAYPFDSYLRAALFPHLSLVDKIRGGPVAIYLRLARNWWSLEKYTAHEWLTRWLGRRAYQILWEPLLVGKFGDYHREVNMAWMWARLHKRTPRLGYFVGGFQAFSDALADRARSGGADIRLNAPVHAIQAAAGGLVLRAASGDEVFDRVIATVSPGLLSRLAPELPSDYLEGLKRLKSMGAVVLILALKHQLTEGHYWINLPKGEGFPFLALVEHTNYVESKHYGGDHLIYCGDYLKPDHEYFSLSQQELLTRFLPTLSRFNPDFEPDWVRTSWLFREKYAQPVPPVNHSHNIPDLATPIPGLYWASMSQVYPWDRGTNYAVEIGQEVARRAISDAGLAGGWN